MRRIVIIGASGHGRVAADIAKLNGYDEIIFLDDDTSIEECSGYPVVNTVDKAYKYSEHDFFVAIGNASARETVSKKLTELNLNIVTLIHPNAVIAHDVKIAEGTVVMAGVVINSGSVIGSGCIINTSSSVDHDNIIEDYVHISVGSHLAGTVSVGRRTWIGIGAAVSNNIAICSDCMVGAGAAVINDINVKGTYVGVPAKRIEKHIVERK